MRSCASCQCALGRSVYKASTRTGEDIPCREGVDHVFCSYDCLAASGNPDEPCKVCAKRANVETIGLLRGCETCHKTFDGRSISQHLVSLQDTARCTAGRLHCFCSLECADTVDGMCQVCREYAKPQKPLEFDELTQEEWDEFWEWEKGFVSLGRSFKSWFYWGGSAINSDKKKNPFVWVKWRGRMMKVAWSFGAYHARHTPGTTVARDYLETLEMFPSFYQRALSGDQEQV